VAPKIFDSRADRHAAGEKSALLDAALAQETPQHLRPSWKRFVAVAVVGGAIWLAPLAILLVTQGTSNVFTQIAGFNSRMAVVTFGGAYAVLAYMTQQAVSTYGWLKPGEMLVGLGFAETTPGPLICVVLFVGYMAAYRNPGALPPAFAGLLGGWLAMWMTFVPPFIWIFLGGPYIEALIGNRALGAALSAITAAVVGVILNLALWFALHTLFGRTVAFDRFGLHLSVPLLASLNLPALVLSVAAAVAMLRFKVPMFATLAACSLAGLAFYA
ncbi:MAG: chromate transporter, partial [Alphaproteobacteria bacterium]|nr:chromate transporter [Alphaproteobacteria bacterium]